MDEQHGHGDVWVASRSLLAAAYAGDDAVLAAHVLVGGDPCFAARVAAELAQLFVDTTDACDHAEAHADIARELQQRAGRAPQG